MLYHFSLIAKISEFFWLFSCISSIRKYLLNILKNNKMSELYYVYPKLND